MSTVILKALSAQATARLIGLVLGDERSWTFFLADCIRKDRRNTSHHGLTLEPVVYLQERCKRPVYHVADVVAFIKEALTLAPPVEKSPLIRTFAVEVDADYKKLPLRMRRAVRIEDRPAK